MNTVAALLIVLTGAIPMNYLEAKQRLVEDSGHAELVVSSITGDFDDHTVAERPKAKNYLNDANRRIEESLVELKTEEVRRVSVVEGQFSIAVNDLRYVSRIDLEDSDGKVRGPLRRTTIGWIRDFFCQILSLIAPGRPQYWCRNTVPVDPPVISNSTFDSVIAPWVLGVGSSVAFDSGTCKVTANSGISFGSMRYDFPAPTDLNGLSIKFDVTDFDATTYLDVKVQGEGVISANLKFEVPVAIGTYEWPIFESVKEYYEESGGSITDQEIIDGLRRVDFITIGFSKPSLGTAYANFDNIYIVDYQVPLGNIVIAPPADAAYTASVYGGYYARAFEEDEDETWVSVNAPNALILMAQAYIELKLHNNWAGFQRFEAQALREASERWANVVYEQASLGRPINEQRLGPINFGENTPGRTTYDPYSGGSFQWVDS